MYIVIAHNRVFCITPNKEKALQWAADSDDSDATVTDTETLLEVPRGR